MTVAPMTVLNALQRRTEALISEEKETYHPYRRLRQTSRGIRDGCHGIFNISVIDSIRPLCYIFHTDGLFLFAKRSYCKPIAYMERNCI